MCRFSFTGGATTAHPDLNQGPADLRSAALAARLYTDVLMDLPSRAHVVTTRGDVHCQPDRA